MLAPLLHTRPAFPTTCWPFLLGCLSNSQRPTQRSPFSSPGLSVNSMDSGTQIRNLRLLPTLGLLHLFYSSASTPSGSRGKEPACKCRKHKTRVRSLSWEDPLEESMVTSSSILPWRVLMDRGVWWAVTVHGVSKSLT